jgi:hypothetical protein
VNKNKRKENMKKDIKTLVMLPIIMVLFVIQSCRQEDNTTFTVEHAFTQPVATSPKVRPDGTARFTGSTVTLAWSSEAAGGNAQSWDVYFGTSSTPPLYKSGVTQTSIDVPVEDGKTYYWRVVIKDARGIITDSYFPGYKYFSFTAVNGLNPKMNVNMSATTNVATAIGMDLAPDDVVDLRLLVLKKSDMSVVKIIDNGVSSESYDGFGGLADGEYLLATDIYSTKNFGDFNAPVSLSLSLKFKQLGIIDTTLTFANVMTNEYPCDLYRTYLATVVKAGPAYTISSTVSYMAPPVITWLGDDATYPSEVTTTESCDAKTMTGLGFGWMLDWWGEIIKTGGTLTYTVLGNTITIPLQPYCTTTYKGAPQPPYSIQGSGTIDNSGAFPVYHIQYDFIQDGQSIGTISNQYGWPTKYFEATITSDPNGLKSARIGSANRVAKPHR